MNLYLKYSHIEISANVILSFLFHQNDLSDWKTHVEQLI